METNDFSLKMKLNEYKNNIFNSRKYWIIYLICISIIFLSLMDMNNYNHPKMEIIVFVLMSILGIFFISFYHSNNQDKDFYKTVFIIIFIFGIVFSFLTPLFCTNDEFEHFVRAEITSNGVIFPEYNETASFNVAGREYVGQFLTIQSASDLAEKGDDGQGIYFMDMVNASIFNTNADTLPINYTPFPFFSAFAQNPFYGYIAPAIGMAIAKLLELNAVWLLWLGRIFNSLLYALLVSYAIKKTPILKMPLFVVACIPIALSQAASVSIDPLINGLGILSIAYFLVLYKSPKKSIDYKPIIKFSILILILGTCKVTYFCFIFLILFIPLENFKEKKYYYYGLLSIIIILAIMVLWSKFYVDPGVHQSLRYASSDSNARNTYNQINYILSHKKDTLIELSHVFNYLDGYLKFQSCFTTGFTSLFLLFLGGVLFLYPHEKFKFKTKLGSLFVFLMLYIGTNFLFMVTWNSVGELVPSGVQARYFLPSLGLLPICLGFNHMEGDKSQINQYILMITITFIVTRIATITTMVY